MTREVEIIPYFYHLSCHLGKLPINGLNLFFKDSLSLKLLFSGWFYIYICTVNVSNKMTKDHYKTQGNMHVWHVRPCTHCVPIFTPLVQLIRYCSTCCCYFAVGISFFVKFLRAMDCFLVRRAIEEINLWPTMSVRQWCNIILCKNQAIWSYK